MKPQLKKHLITAIKIIVSAGLIYLVFRKLDWKQIGELIKTIKTYYFFLGIGFFILSQITSVYRFELFIRKVGVRISFLTNVKLYLLGMFYNFFLPGGVGGDAYKAMALSRYQGKSLKKVVQVVFVERFLGLVAIVFLIGILALFLETNLPYYLNMGVFFLALMGTFIVLKLVIRIMHTHKKRIYIGFLYSIVIQIAQIISVLFLLLSFQIQGDYIPYLFMFLVSSILSVISFAGLGIREAVFYFGAEYFKFNPDVSASVALSFSLITAGISFLGIIYLFKEIDLKRL